MMPNAVVLGSANPAKRSGVEAALEQAFAGSVPRLLCREVASGVADQPWGDDETRHGAGERARAALATLPGPTTIGLGIEGGVARESGILWSFSWAVAIGGDGRRGAARSGAFALPPAVTELVEDGIELGDACDRVFATMDSKRRQGAVGLLTGGVLGRPELYRHATLLALIPWLSDALYAG